MKAWNLKRRIAAALLVLVVVIFGIGSWYLSDYSHADIVARGAMADEDGTADGVTVRRLSDKAVAFVPENPVAGFVFYPGGKVEPAAYAPLLTQCAREGVLCVLIEPLFNLSVLSPNDADGIQEQFPQVKTWIIGGHSLGGVTASQYLSHHASSFDYLVLLAAYPSSDLSEFPGEVLSVIGTYDEVIDRNDYENAETQLPNNAREYEIEGGNHAYFGNYGEQAGDGKATITREEQQRQTAALIRSLLD